MGTICTIIGVVVSCHINPATRPPTAAQAVAILQPGAFTLPLLEPFALSRQWQGPTVTIAPYMPAPSMPFVPYEQSVHVAGMERFNEMSEHQAYRNRMSVSVSVEPGDSGASSSRTGPGPGPGGDDDRP